MLHSDWSWTAHLGSGFVTTDLSTLYCLTFSHLADPRLLILAVDLTRLLERESHKVTEGLKMQTFIFLQRTYWLIAKERSQEIIQHSSDEGKIGSPVKNVKARQLKFSSERLWLKFGCRHFMRSWEKCENSERPISQAQPSHLKIWFGKMWPLRKHKRGFVSLISV